MPVRTASRLLGDWIRRTGEIWVEGQISQLKPRRSVAWITLRDTDADLSIPLMAPMSAVQAGMVQEGHRVVARLKADYFPKNGSLNWRAMEFRPVGLGALMQRLEELRKLLAAEGLFKEERKRPLPFLPRRIGLICGRGSAARHDVVVNAERQWPSAVFEVREVAVQGNTAVTEMITALVDLDGADDVDVIVLTRGGGSLEDLLPFSNEALVRTVSECLTPVVSAIGHEEDHPIVDQVADARASTPTAAGKMVVPDLATEIQQIQRHRHRIDRLVRDRVAHERGRFDNLRNRPVLISPDRVLHDQRDAITSSMARMRRSLGARVSGEQTRLHGLRQRPVLTRPDQMLRPRTAELDQFTATLRRSARRRIDQARRSFDNDVARLRTLSPQGTLDRGYAVVQNEHGTLVRDAEAVSPGQRLRVRVAVGGFAVDVATAPANQLEEL